MDTKNYILQQQIYTPSVYNQLLSIVVVMQNIEKPLECLENVLQQIYQPFEVIIINNSTDASFNLINNYILNNHITNVYLYHTTTDNIYECLNIGLSYTKGNYIAFHINNDRSSHLRFLYQINDLIINRLNSPQMSLCLSYNKHESSSLCFNSLCFKRSVFNTIGYLLTEYNNMCFEEYIWRYLVYNGSITNNDEKQKASLLNNLYPSVCIINKILFEHVDIEMNDDDKNDIIEKYNLLHMNKQFMVKYKQSEPIVPKSYLNNVMNILSGDLIENRITLVYYVTTPNDEALVDFYNKFNCFQLPLIICYTSDIDIKCLKQNKTMKRAVYKKVHSYADGYYKVLSDNNILTPYVFMLQDKYYFDTKSLLHPLSYILDIMDKYKGYINTLKFSSITNEDDTPINLFQNPNMVYTTKFTDEPCIMKVKHGNMFYKPFIDSNGRGDLGVSDKLNKKYSNKTLALKLQMCIYGGCGYPATTYIM